MGGVRAHPPSCLLAAAAWLPLWFHAGCFLLFVWGWESWREGDVVRGLRWAGKESLELDGADLL